MKILKQVFKTQIFPIIIIFLIAYTYSYIMFELGRTSAKHEFIGLLIQEESVTTDSISIEDLKHDVILMR